MGAGGWWRGSAACGWHRAWARESGGSPVSIWRSPDGSMELRLGKWETALADIGACDVVIADAPFSARVHKGQRTGSSTRKATINYDSLTAEDAFRFVDRWGRVGAHWSVVFGDHLAARWWEGAWMAAGWYVFAPLPWVRTNCQPRLVGDGPTSAADYVIVARPKRKLAEGRGGSRRGYYLSTHAAKPGFNGVSHPGAKDLPLMRALIRDYTMKGDLIVDPYAGIGTTLIAAAIEGRRAIGAEVDPETFEKAVDRLSSGYTADMWAGP